MNKIVYKVLWDGNVPPGGVSNCVCMSTRLYVVHTSFT